MTDKKAIKADHKGASPSSKFKKTVVAVVGGAVLLVGILAIPYPGPGWLIVFAGLGILSTEFEWASRLLSHARGKYDAFQAWLKRQNVSVRVAFWMLTAIVVVLTIYLLNGYGILNGTLNLDQQWLISPIFK